MTLNDAHSAAEDLGLDPTARNLLFGGNFARVYA
jgi:hypothetical protein